MANLRVLFLPYYFPPMGGMGSLRALGFVRHLPAAGVDVTVVAPCTGTYGHDDSLSVPADVRVIRTGTLEPAILRRRSAGVATTGATGRVRTSRLARWIHVPDANAGWIPFAVRAALRVAREESFDFVLSSAGPLSSHVAAGMVAARLRRPHILDYRDFPDMLRRYPGIRDRLDGWIEDSVLGRAAGIVTASDGIRDELARRTSAPTIVIPNGYDEEDFGDPVPEVDAPFTLVHVGSCYAGLRSPAAFLRASARFRETAPGFRLRFVGAPDSVFTTAARAAGMDDAIDVVPFTTHAAAVSEMRAAPALLLFLWAAPAFEGGLRAGKTLEYLRSGRPVLFAGPLDSENARVVRETGGAILIDPDDEDGLFGAISDLAAGRLPAPADRAGLAAFSRPTGARRLAEWLADL